MEISLYINCFIGGILGVLFYLVVRIRAERKRAYAANVPFKWQEYVKADILTIFLSVLTIIISLFVLDELIGYNPAFLNFIKFFFVFVGYTGSSLLTSVLGTFSNRVQAIVDVKTTELEKLKLEIKEREVDE